jgi:hypothetical protein
MLKNNKNAIFEVVVSKNLKDIKQNWMDIKQNRFGTYFAVYLARCFY